MLNFFSFSVMMVFFFLEGGWKTDPASYLGIEIPHNNNTVRTISPYYHFRFRKCVGMLRGHNAPIFYLFVAEEENRIFSVSTDKCIKVNDRNRFQKFYHTKFKLIFKKKRLNPQTKESIEYELFLWKFEVSAILKKNKMIQ